MPDSGKLIDNTSIWANVREVDRRYTKPITGKGYKGDSINPTYMVMRATEVLGPAGIGWGVHVLDEKVYEGSVLDRVPIEETTEIFPPLDGGGRQVRSKTVKYQIIREQWHQVRIQLWIKNNDGSITTTEAFGGTQMFTVSSKGKWIFDEDAAKKSMTDAMNKALSQLGVGADVFLGLFDDKYAPQIEGADQPPANRPPAQRQISDSPEDRRPPPDQDMNRHPGNRSNTTDDADWL